MMNKWVIVIFVLFILFVAGCKDESDNLKSGDVLEGFAQTDNSVDVDSNQETLDKQNSKQMQLAKTCDFLTASDVQQVCDTDVEMIKLDEMYGPCTFRFENEAEHYLRLTYYEYPPTDSKDRMYNYCIRADGGGEKIEEFICATPTDKNVYVFGDYYSISLGEEYDYNNNKVCKFDKIKELGKIVKEKIYS